MRKSYLGIFCFIMLFSINLQSHPQYPDFHPRWDVPYIPTPHEVVTTMLDMANVQSSDILYDLGCGDGRIIITAAQRFGTTGIGIDIDPERITDCYANAATAKRSSKPQPPLVQTMSVFAQGTNKGYHPSGAKLPGTNRTNS